MNRKIQIKEVKEIANLVKENWTRQAIADKLGISKRSVEYWIKRLKGAGVKVNSKRGPKPLKI